MDELNCNIEVISLAKREEEVFVPGKSTPYILPRNSYALKLLQRIRDEAHRFAITFHRNLRKKRQTTSSLLKIQGVGEKRIKLLFEKFSTLENIKNATENDLNLIKGIDQKTAKNIYTYFHPQN